MARMLSMGLLAACTFIASTASAQEPLAPFGDPTDATITTPTLELDARDLLIRTLSHYEVSPSQAQLDGLGVDDLHRELIALAADPGMLRITRGRAINALAQRPLAPTREFIDRYLAEDNKDLYILGHLVRLVGLHLGAQDPAWALSTITPYLQHQDASIRESAVRGLFSLRRDDTVKSQVDEWLMQVAIAERSVGVRGALVEGFEEIRALQPAGRDEIQRATR